MDVRKACVLDQLRELFGANYKNPVTYFDKVWNNELLISGQPVITRPHQNNGHAVLHAAYMDDRLYFSGTESASQFAGYMEGAIIAAKSVANRL